MIAGLLSVAASVVGASGAVSGAMGAFVPECLRNLDGGALKRVMAEAVAGVAWAGDQDLSSRFSALGEAGDAGAATKERLEAISGKLGAVADSAIDGLATMLAAAGTGPAAFDLRHAVLRDRGHTWLCSVCADSPQVASAALSAAGGAVAGPV